jgi:hypothetical protein
MNDKLQTYNFMPLNIREGYRGDGMQFADCSECGEHIAFTHYVFMGLSKHTLKGRTWGHKLLFSDTSSVLVDFCPVVKHREEVVRVSKLTDAYKLVIEDITNDIGYVKGVKENALMVLANRLTELVEVWKHEDEESETATV